ncbi:MAG: tRNA 2-selenouridine(34) synthase MnmH [Pseudobdellovibrionaceae bacterium]
MRIEDYRSLFIEDTPLIDVRAPVEFLLGSLPGSQNFPILTDEERAAVGTTYKEKGQDAAMELGHVLVSGQTKERRLQQWLQFIKEHPKTVLYCFRGGQRSQITQKWLQEAGTERPLIQGGYKAVRQFLMDESDRISKTAPLMVISGPTGSGKTKFVQSFQAVLPTVDLEDLARHRGSAFGAMTDPQPSQIDFENTLAVKILKLEDRLSNRIPVLIEDESRMIGARHLPETLFDRMRAALVVWIDDPIERRVDRILKEYVQNPLENDPGGEKVFAKFQKAVQAIHKRLGGLRTQEILQDLAQSEAAFQKGDLEPNRAWIEKLLSYYYDPLYLKSLDRRQVSVAFRGNFEACQDFVQKNFIK